MGESQLEETLGEFGEPRPLKHTPAYIAYVEAHKNDSRYRIEDTKPKHTGTGLFGILMAVPIIGVTYELAMQLSNPGPYSQPLSTGYVALDLTLCLLTALFGKIVWDYESMPKRI